MDDITYIPTRSERLQELIKKPYDEAEKELYRLISKAVFKPTMDDKHPENRESRKMVLKYLIEKSGENKSMIVDDMVCAIEGLDSGSDQETFSSVMNRYRQLIGALYTDLPLFIRRTEDRKNKKAYRLDTGAVSAFNQKYRDTVEFISGYKGDLRLLLLDELDRLN